MSTICKLDPRVRIERTKRKEIIQGNFKMDWRQRAIMDELALIYYSSRLTGSTKNVLFQRGINQGWGVKPE